MCTQYNGNNKNNIMNIISKNIFTSDCATGATETYNTSIICITDSPVEEDTQDYTTTTRRKTVHKKYRVQRKSQPEGLRWQPAEKVIHVRGSPADRKAKDLAMRVKRERKWVDPFLPEETEDAPIKVRTPRSPIYDKPCAGVIANYGISKWPTCPELERKYIAPKWPVNIKG